MLEENNKLEIPKTKETSIFSRLSKLTLSLIFYTLSITAVIASSLLIWTFSSYSSNSKLNTSLSVEIEKLLKQRETKHNSTNLMLIQNSQMKQYAEDESNWVNSLKVNLTALRKLIDAQEDATKLNYERLISESTILKSQKEINLIHNKSKGYIDSMCFSSTKHDFSPNEVRRRCKEAERTVVLYKSEEGDRFGGYTTIKWKENTPRYMMDSEAFIFSLTNMLIFPVRNTSPAVKNDVNCFPSFGLREIECCLGLKCSSLFPFGYGGEVNMPKDLMNKSYFYLKELEVYKVIPQL